MDPHFVANTIYLVWTSNPHKNENRKDVEKKKVIKKKKPKEETVI